MQTIKAAKSLGVAAVLVAAGAGPAWAGTVFQGNDYSYVDNGNRNAVICDQEADGRTAYVKGVTLAGNSFRVDDLDGSSGSCWYQTYQSGVAWHETCEDINNAPDDCGNRSYH